MTAAPLSFGHAALAQRIVAQLVTSLQPGAGSNMEPALVVGVFGEWGAGKSRLLQTVAEALPRGDGERSLTVVVPFNAWRYEREQHLLAPAPRGAAAGTPPAAAGRRAEQPLLRLPGTPQGRHWPQPQGVGPAPRAPQVPGPGLGSAPRLAGTRDAGLAGHWRAARRARLPAQPRLPRRRPGPLPARQGRGGAGGDQAGLSTLRSAGRRCSCAGRR